MMCSLFQLATFGKHGKIVQSTIVTAINIRTVVRKKVGFDTRNLDALVKRKSKYQLLYMSKLQILITLYLHSGNSYHVSVCMCLSFLSALLDRREKTSVIFIRTNCPFLITIQYSSFDDDMVSANQTIYLYLKNHSFQYL